MLHRITRGLFDLLHREEGHAMVEYCVVLAVIICSIIFAVYTVGQHLTGK